MRIQFPLVVVAALLLSACSSLTGAGDPNTAATVGGDTIPLATVERQFENATQNPQLAQQLEADPEGQVAQQVQAQILTFLVHAAIVEQGADELGVDVSDADIEATREQIAEQLGGEEAFAAAIEQNQLADEDVDAQVRSLAFEEAIRAELLGDEGVSDEELQDAYEAQYGGDAPRARHLLVESQEEAQQARERIEAGEDFEAVARDVSTDPSVAENGGDLGVVQPGQTVPAFEEALFAAEPGALVGPVETDFGFHVIQRLEPPPLDDVRDELAEQVQAEEGQAAFDEWLTERRADAEVDVNPRFGTWSPEQGAVVVETEDDGQQDQPAATEPAPAPTE